MLDLDTLKRLFIAALLISGILGIAGWQTNVQGLPSGSIVFITSGTCPPGYSEVSALSARTLEFTVAANANVGTTGGSDTITPAGTIASSSQTKFTTSSTGTLANTTAARTFVGTSFDNRPAFVRVIGCKAN